MWCPNKVDHTTWTPSITVYTMDTTYIYYRLFIVWQHLESLGWFREVKPSSFMFLKTLHADLSYLVLFVCPGDVVTCTSTIILWKTVYQSGTYLHELSVSSSYQWTQRQRATWYLITQLRLSPHTTIGVFHQNNGKNNAACCAIFSIKKNGHRNGNPMDPL